MNLTLTLLMDRADVEKFTAYLGAMGRRASRDALLPKLKDAFVPLVQAELANLSGHVVSGALVSSLSARAGAGDRPGTMSVFSSPTATVKQLQATWGKGRRQQQGWASRLSAKGGRRRIFYGPIVHQGHRIVVRGSDGKLRDTGKRIAPVPFASQAVEAMGESQAEAAAGMILDHILNGGE
jgi:hypothetical protein